VLGDKALMVTELIPTTEFYDFDAKYTDGLTRMSAPPRSPRSGAGLQGHRPARASVAGLQGTSRSDFRWDDEQGVEGLFLLEVNTQPGMTPLSLVPEQARHLGMDYADLVEAIVAEALADAKAKKGA
jgi:D-alanine-D-alanine ligase